MLFLRWYLWVAPVGLCVLLLLVAARSRRLRTFPAFFTLVACYVVQFLVLFFSSFLGSPVIYRWSLIIVTVVSFPLEVAVLYELANKLIFSRCTLARLLKPLPGTITAATALFAAVLTALIPSSSQNAIIRIFENLNLGIAFFEFCLLLAMLLLTRTLAIPWQSLPAGIALGFGISSFTEIVGSLLMARLGHPVYILSDIIRLSGFHAAVVVWLWVVVRQDTLVCGSTPCVQVADLNRHVDDVTGIIREISQK